MRIRPWCLPTVLVTSLALPSLLLSQAETINSTCPTQPRKPVAELGSDTIPADTFKMVTEAEQRVVCINWFNAAGKNHRLRDAAIRARAPVTLYVHHFNFLHYTVQFDIQEDTVEAYRNLEKLWSQVIFLAPGLLGPNQNRDFDRALFQWVTLMGNTEDRLDRVLRAYTSVGLNDKQIAAIKAEIEPLGVTAIAALEAARERALTAFAQPSQEPFERFALYERRLADHRRLIERLDAFAAAARRTVGGERKLIQARPSGTIVTVTMTAKDRHQTTATAGKPVTVEYFVQSRLPLVFHTGVAYNSLRQVNFEKIRTLSGADAWEQTRDDTEAVDVTAFLSLPIPVLPYRSGERLFLLTLGTELASPGKTLFVGATLRPSRRLFLTGGLSSATIEEGENEILDRVGEELKTRELFDAISHRRHWGFFASLTFNVID